MLLKTILNRIHPIKGFVYGDIKIFDNGPSSYIHVHISPRTNSRGRCSICGKKLPGYDHTYERQFEFIPLWNIPVQLLYRPRRVTCPEHGIIVESIPWAQGKERTTKAFQLFLAQWARLLSWQTVANRFKTSWDTVSLSVKRIVDYGLVHRDLSGVEAIGVDEMAIGKGHNYITAVYQIDGSQQRLLWLGEKRTVKALLRFFVEFGKQKSELLKFVCTDMWKPYLKVIKKKAPQALNILDRFHIMKKFNFAIDETRRDEQSELEKDGYEPVLLKSRWTLLKNPDNLTDKQGLKLKTLLQYNLKTVRAYLLREEFQQFWAYTSPYWAEKFLDEWIRKTLLSQIEPMKKVAQMLRSHKPLIMNWFTAKGRFSSGVVESLNNVAKVTMRKSYGFRNYETLKYALYHTIGKLPLPQTTHEFF
jgi:transposase